MSSTLESLPLEILHMILAYLGIEGSGTDKFEPPDAHFRYSRQKYDQPSWYSLKLQPLLSLCLVSKRLCNFIRPILYREFMLGYGDSWRSDLYTWDGRLLSFLRTIARRRDLAGFVKKIHILPHLLQASHEDLEKEEKDRQQMYKALLPPDIDFDNVDNGVVCCWPLAPEVPPRPELRRFILEEEARDTLREVSIALKIKQPERLSAKDLITLLIAALPTLEHCSLFFGPNSYMTAVDSATLSAAGISQLPLRTINLSVLRTTEAHFDFDRNARALLEVSPYLETLNLHKCYATQQQATLPSLPSLKHIRITGSRLNDQGLEIILNSCNSLCSFTYEAGENLLNPGLERRWDYSNHFRLRNAARYLSRHQKTLESLHIDLRNRGGLPATPSSFSFRELTALKHLFLNLYEFHSRFFMHCLTDDSQLLVQILPPVVNSLHLAGHIGEDLPRLEKGLLGLGEAAGKGQFQELKEVRWDSEARLDAEDTVKSLFADAGIDFTFDSWPETRLSFYQEDYIPPANFNDPYYIPLPDEDDPDL